jgi:hypothetical protein
LQRGKQNKAEIEENKGNELKKQDGENEKRDREYHQIYDLVNWIEVRYKSKNTSLFTRTPRAATPHELWYETI